MDNIEDLIRAEVEASEEAYANQEDLEIPETSTMCWPNQPNPYHYRVIWSAEDEEYVGLVEEFPSLSWLEREQDAALSGIRRLVDEVVDLMRADGEQPPTPR